MPRRRVAAKREILPDPKYNDRRLARFINIVMKCGKKSTAEKIVYGALATVVEKGKPDALQSFNDALENIRPHVEVKSRRVGGATYQVPTEVSADRGLALAMRWLVDASRRRNEKSMGLRLAGEIMDACDSRGSAVKKREDSHKMADANKAFSHYRW